MAEGTPSVQFMCQRCLQPLKLDPSFNTLGEHTLAELSLPIYPAPEMGLEAQAANLPKFVPPFKFLADSGSGANGFTLVENESRGIETFSHKLRMTADLFDLLSSNTEVNHPLCEECTDALLDLMDNQLRLTEDERNDYTRFLQQLEAETEEEDVEVLKAQLNELQAKEQELMEELESLCEEERHIRKELHAAEEEKEKLQCEEERYLRELVEHKRQVMAAEEEGVSLACQAQWCQAQLERLERTNVFNATFHIWHSGHFATINHFRLGRLPSAPVDWPEINAAWGQTVLLLAALARKMNLSFQKYRLVPYGNHSYVQVLADKRELPLYGAGGIRFLWDNKFDAAMVAFLECLQQFKEEVERGDSGFCLPYPMERGRINDNSTNNSYSVKIQFNSEEQWTKALKFMLTNLKWVLAWVSSQFAQDGSSD